VNIDFIDARPLYMSRMAWDMGPHEDMGAVLSALGVVPPSGESFESEHSDSHNRLALVENLRPKIEWLSQISACVLACLMLDKPGLEDESEDGSEDDDDEPVSEEERGEFIETQAEMISLATSAILATLIYDQLTQRGFKFFE